MPHIITKIERADPAAVAGLAKFGSATVHEAQGRLGALNSRIKPIDRAMRVCGPAFTVLSAPRDNIMLQLAIHYAKPGDVVNGDADGLVVVRREDAAEVVKKCAAREDAEAGYIEAYKAGRTIIDVCNLEAVLKAKGLTTDLD